MRKTRRWVRPFYFFFHCHHTKDTTIKPVLFLFLIRAESADCSPLSHVVRDDTHALDHGHRALPLANARVKWLRRSHRIEGRLLCAARGTLVTAFAVVARRIVPPTMRPP